MKQKKNLKIHDVVVSYQHEVINELFSWNQIDFMFHRHMIQYLSINHMNQLKNIFDNTINYLIENNIDNKQVLNIGTGIGLLEAVGKLRNYNIDCTETKFLSIDNQKLIPDFDPYKLIRSKLNSRVTYWTNSIFDQNFTIDQCVRRYNYGLLIRFTPLTEDCTSNNDYNILFNNLKKYVNNVLIIDDIRKVPNFLQKYKLQMIYQINALYNVPLSDNNITQN